MTLLRCAAIAATISTPMLFAACHHAPRADDSQISPDAAVAPPGVTYAGTWAYDLRRSDRPGQGRGGYSGAGGGRRGGMGGGMGGGGGGGGMGGGRRGGGGGGGTGGGMPGRGEGEAGGEAAMGRLVRRLVIIQTDSTISLAANESQPLVLRFDGRAVTVPGPREGTAMTVTAHWSKGRIQVRRSLADRITTTESYEKSKDGTRLTIHERTSVGPDDTNPPETKRVYDLIGN